MASFAIAAQPHRGRRRPGSTRRFLQARAETTIDVAGVTFVGAGAHWRVDAAAVHIEFDEQHRCWDLIAGGESVAFVSSPERAVAELRRRRIIPKGGS